MTKTKQPVYNKRSYHNVYRHVFETALSAHTQESNPYAGQDIETLKMVQATYSLIINEKFPYAACIPENKIIAVNPYLDRHCGFHSVPFILAHEVKHALLYENSEQRINMHGLSTLTDSVHKCVADTVSIIPQYIADTANMVKSNIRQKNPFEETWETNALSALADISKSFADVLSAPTYLLHMGAMRMLEKECDIFALHTFPETDLHALRDFFYVVRNEKHPPQNTSHLGQFLHNIYYACDEMAHPHPHPETRYHYLAEEQKRYKPL